LNSPFQDHFLWITEQIGYDKLIFGSDFPLFSQEEAISALKEFGFKEENLPQILGKNFEQLVDLWSLLSSSKSLNLKV